MDTGASNADAGAGADAYIDSDVDFSVDSDNYAHSVLTGTSQCLCKF